MNYKNILSYFIIYNYNYKKCKINLLECIFSHSYSIQLHLDGYINKMHNQ